MSIFGFVTIALFGFSCFVVRADDQAAFSLSSLLQDPRHNSSFYDLIVKHSSRDNSGVILVGNVANVLLQKGTGPKWDYITKYKLIYYSPQLLPSAAYDTSTTPASSVHAESPSEPVFTVNEKNGSIWLHTPPHEPVLEHLCMSRLYCSCLSCIFSLNIIYTTSNRVSAETVRVFIDDFNDFAPQFHAHGEGMLHVNISEASRIGDAFRLPNSAAFDSDAYYNKVSYLVSEQRESETRSNMFDVAPAEPPGKDLVIILKSHLDYELTREYDLYLIAKDNGPVGGRSSSIRLRVHVIDENDNSPVCEKSLFMESVRENSLAENFLQIRATDLDSISNGRLVFSILESGASDDSQRFVINKSTGWLSVQKELDYETKSFYELVIRVDDTSARNNFTTYCSARVNVLDVNDNAAKLKVIKYLNESVQAGFYSLNSMSEAWSWSLTPLDSSFEPAFFYSRNQIEIIENNSPHTVLALIRVFDRDSISHYRFSIQSATNSHEDTTMFEIRYSDRVNREFELIATAPFNSELIQSYRLKIVLYDLDSFISTDTFVSNDSLMFTKKPSADILEPSKNIFQVALFQHVRILDVNDNKPEFVKKTYEFFLDENGFNTSLRMPPIEVYDVDTSERNSRLQFRLGELGTSSRAAAGIGIREHVVVLDTEANYPLLHVIKPFDYETHGEKVEFELVAFDVDNLNDSCLITIHVRDLNDNAPIFMNDNATFVIRENSPANSFIGQVIAIDRDSSGPNADISFRIESDSLRAYFKIYKTGVISNWIPLDREAHSEFTLHVEAYNTNDASLSRRGVYHVRVEDENDNRPRFVYPRENSTRLILKLPAFELFPNSTNLIRIFDAKAIDEDLGENGRVVYSLETLGSLANSFLIDKSNGSVYFNFFAFNITNLEQLARFRGTFRLVLSARDSAPSPLSASAINLTLYLNYELSELSAELPVSSSVLRSTVMATEFDEFGLLSVNEFESQSSERNFFQLVSNGVLLVILITVLMFMLFVACFLFIIFYKKNSVSELAGKKIDAASSGQENSTNRSSSSCFGRVKSSLKIKTSVVKSSSLGNLKAPSMLSKKSEANLTVKDASPNETVVEPILGNSFKVTIKSSDPTSKNQSQFVFDNLTTSKTKLNSDNDLVIEKPSPPAVATDTNMSGLSTASTCSNEQRQLCIADFSRSHQFVSQLEARSLQPNVSYSNSNNSTLIINSLSPTSSSSLSNTPLRGSYNIGAYTDSKLRPSATPSSTHLATSNTIKFILSSQLAAAAQRESSNLPGNLHDRSAGSKPAAGNNTEDMLQNLLEKFEKFYNNSLDSSFNLKSTGTTFDRH